MITLTVELKGSFMKNNITSFFIDNAEIFLKVMLHRWEQGLEEAKWIRKILESNDIYEGRILDLMCGIGRHSVYLAEAGYEVVGIDFSPLFIRYAEKIAKRMGVSDRTKFIVGDARDLSIIPEKFKPFDAVINIWTSIGYFGEEGDITIFNEARKVTRDYGLLIVGDTISKESLEEDFCPTSYVEFPDLLILHFAEYYPLSSTINDLWRFYEKKGDNWIYLRTVKLSIRIYSLGEFASMLKKTGWKVIEAYDSLIGLTPLKKNSRINIVAIAIE